MKHIKMRYSIQPRDIGKRIRFLSFAKNIGKNLSKKYRQKLLDSATKSLTDAIKTVSKRPIQITAEATGDLISNKIPHKITTLSKKSTKELQNNETELNTDNASPKDVNIPKKYIFPEERQHIIEKLRLI